jgi:hypothetical protein
LSEKEEKKKSFIFREIFPNLYEIEEKNQYKCIDKNKIDPPPLLLSPHLQNIKEFGKIRIRQRGGYIYIYGYSLNDHFLFLIYAKI